MTGSINSFTYAYGSPTVTVPMPVYAASPNCGASPIAYQLVLQSGGAAPPAFTLDLTNKKFVVTQGVAIAYPAVYPLKIIAKETYNNVTTNQSCLFAVTIICTQSITVTTNPIPATVTYILDPNVLVKINLTMPTYQQNPSLCQTGFSFSIVNYITGVPCQSWITCNPVTGGQI